MKKEKLRRKKVKYGDFSGFGRPKLKTMDN
jgi:hypothetical protein